MLKRIAYCVSLPEVAESVDLSAAWRPNLKASLFIGPHIAGKVRKADAK